MKKISKAKQLKKLLIRAEEAWKAAVHRRDKSTCQMCGASKSSGAVVQIDHCFSRSVHQLKFNVRNGTALCSGCHLLKSFHKRAYEKRVDDLVRKREGAAWWEDALEIAIKGGSYSYSVVELNALIVDLDGAFI